MKFHALLPVRDEADIIGQCLRQLLNWADAVYVFDTGSFDETWEIVHQFSGTDKRVIPLKKDAVYFSENRVRAWMFHQARKRMRQGDWFLRVDADEFHHIHPPDFVKTRMRKHETIAYHQYYDFRLTKSELAAWVEGRESLADRSRPIEERRRWFTPSLYTEPRLCRYRETMRWPPSVSFPFNAGYVATERLPIRHYPHRDTAQLRRRCLVRALMLADPRNRANWSRPEMHHWAEREWRKFIAEDNLEGLRFWTPNEELPEFCFTNHLAKPHIRAVQQFAHACLLPLVDRLRPAWPENAYPAPIEPERQRRLREDLGS